MGAFAAHLQNQIGALKAENERLTFANNTITLAAKIAAERAEAAERALAERAGGVKELAADLTELLRCIDQVQGRPATESVYGIYNPNSPFGRIVEKVRASVDALTTKPAAPERVPALTQVGWTYQDKKWDADRWHVCGWEKPREHEGRRVEPIYIVEPATPEGWQEAVRIGDAVLDWMVKFDLLDGGNEYYVSDVLAVLNDLTPSTRPSEHAVTDEMVARASAEYQVIFGKYLLSSHARRILKAAMEAGR